MGTSMDHYTRGKLAPRLLPAFKVASVVVPPLTLAPLVDPRPRSVAPPLGLRAFSASDVDALSAWVAAATAEGRRPPPNVSLLLTSGSKVAARPQR
jgi:hypothetical protein